MPSSVSTEVIDSNTFHPFPNDALPLKASHSSNTTATESPVSSDVDNTMQPESPHRISPNRLPPDSPYRSPNVNYGSPHRSPTVNTNSPQAHGCSPSDRSLVHTRTNFGKTRGYVPPMVPTSSPGRVTDPPNVPPSPRGNMMTNRTPFEEEDAPDDEARFRTVRSLRPKPSQYHSDGSIHSQSRRHDMREMTAPVSPPRPEAYISETDESSLGQHGDFAPRRVLQPLPSVASQEQDARPPTPEQPYDVFPARSNKEHRHPSPIKKRMSPIVRSRAKKKKSSVPEGPRSSVPERSQSMPESPKSPRHRTAGELGDLRRRRRRIKSKKASQPPAPEQAPQQFAMPFPTVEPPAPDRVTSSKTSSDLTDDSIPSFDDHNSLVKRVMESEMEYHEESTVVPPPVESPGYEEFLQDRKASESPRKQKPKSILRSKRTKSKGAENDDDDDSLFDFASASGEKLLGERTSIRKSALKSGNTSSNRKGRPRRRRSKETGNDDDESLIQYGEVRKLSSSLQERTQEAWTFRSKRSFSASSPKAITAGVHFENTNTVHHFDDQETVGTTGTNHSLNSLYTKSPESEAEDLIKDLLMIGSGGHSNPGRRKLKYQPEYKRVLKEKDDRSVDDNTLGTTDISLNTLDNTAGGTAYTEATPHTRVDDDTKLGTSPQGKSDGLSRSACETLDSKSTKNNAEDPLAAVWDFVESGMQALGLSSSPTDPPSEPTENEFDETKVVEKAMSGEDSDATETPKEEEPAKDTNAEENVLPGVTSSDLQGINADYPGEDEVKEEPKGSFGEVMDYIFRDPLQKDKVCRCRSFVTWICGCYQFLTGSVIRVFQKDKQSNISSVASSTTSSTLLEEDPRLEELALHAVKSKHQMFDLVYDESVPFVPEKDIKFSLVKTKLPLGSK